VTELFPAELRARGGLSRPGLRPVDEQRGGRSRWSMSMLSSHRLMRAAHARYRVCRWGADALSYWLFVTLQPLLRQLTAPKGGRRDPDPGPVRGACRRIHLLRRAWPAAGFPYLPSNLVCLDPYPYRSTDRARQAHQHQHEAARAGAATQAHASRASGLATCML
jgi:hypothetical protein